MSVGLELALDDPGSLHVPPRRSRFASWSAIRKRETISESMKESSSPSIESARLERISGESVVCASTAGAVTSWPRLGRISGESIVTSWVENEGLGKEVTVAPCLCLGFGDALGFGEALEDASSVWQPLLSTCNLR